MTALAIVLGILAILAAVLSVVAIRILMVVMLEVRDALRTLHVLVNGLEAALKPDVQQARESADAACVQLDALAKRLENTGVADQGAPPESAASTPFRRVDSARAVFAQLEADSYEAMQQGIGVKRG